MQRKTSPTDSSCCADKESEGLTVPIVVSLSYLDTIEDQLDRISTLDGDHKRFLLVESLIAFFNHIKNNASNGVNCVSDREADRIQRVVKLVNKELVSLSSCVKSSPMHGHSP